jgi:uncharacterized surface protein with fasciclin (FAS1) repeats
MGEVFDATHETGSSRAITKGEILNMKLVNSALKQLANFAFALTLFFAVGIVPSVTASANGSDEKKSDAARSADIVDTAVAAGSFTTLAQALEAAGLIDTLKGQGPFTVFAPTDAAFAKLPAGTIASLLKPENKEKLQAILLYHVVQGKVTAADVMKLNGRSVKTLQGGMFKVSTKHGVRVDKSNVTQTDIGASNGVIHVIDTVLMPPGPTARVTKNTRKM